MRDKEYSYRHERQIISIGQGALLLREFPSFETREFILNTIEHWIGEQAGKSSKKMAEIL